MHPFSKARERTRALNAAKMERIFAKPFVDSLEGHLDAIEVLCRKPHSLNIIASGSWDGGIIMHNLTQRSRIATMQGTHKGKVSGLCFSQDDRLLSCGVDRSIKIWNTSTSDSTPVSVLTGKFAFKSVFQ